MKFILLLTCLLFTQFKASANDIADAKTAFATMLEYQKSDDPRTLDLFAPGCSITFTFSDGMFTKSAVVPEDIFRDTITKELAEKHGNKDTYEDVKYVQEGVLVRVTAIILYVDTGKRGPISVLYERDKNGTFRIKELKVTVPVKDALSA